MRLRADARPWALRPPASRGGCSAAASRLAMAASLLLGLRRSGGALAWPSASEPRRRRGVAHGRGAAGVAAHRRAGACCLRCKPCCAIRTCVCAAGAGLVSYANSCVFRGHHVPHLVVQTEAGPVTVMVLVHESGVVRRISTSRLPRRHIAGAGPRRSGRADAGCDHRLNDRTHGPAGARFDRLDRLDQMPTSPSKSTNRRVLAANVG